MANDRQIPWKAINTAPSDPYLDISRGLIPSQVLVMKFGANPDIDTGTLPEDIIHQGGVFTFPSAAERLEVFSASASDTAAGVGARSLYLEGLDGSYNTISETVALNGITGVLTTQSFLRLNRAYAATAGTSESNVGAITIRQSTTTTNIMADIGAADGQTHSSVYTVAAGWTAYYLSLNASFRGASSITAELGLMVKTFGGALRIRRPFALNFGGQYFDKVHGGIQIPEKSDIFVRCFSVSANNVNIICSYDLLLIKNTA